MKWVKGAKEGIVVAGDNSKGDQMSQLSSPRGVIVDQFGQIYVSDYGNDCVMWRSKGRHDCRWWQSSRTTSKSIEWPCRFGFRWRRESLCC